MDGWGVDIRAPRVPYVTSTILVKRPVENYLWRPVLRPIYTAAFGAPFWEQDDDDDFVFNVPANYEIKTDRRVFGWENYDWERDDGSMKSREPALKAAAQRFERFERDLALGEDEPL